MTSINIRLVSKHAQDIQKKSRELRKRKVDCHYAQQEETQQPLRVPPPRVMLPPGVEDSPMTEPKRIKNTPLKSQTCLRSQGSAKSVRNVKYYTRKEVSGPQKRVFYLRPPRLQKDFEERIRSSVGEGSQIIKVRDVKWRLQKLRRCGVIPWTVIESKLFFCLGVDADTKELTDFGGGIKLRDRTPLHCAIREFREETKAVFGDIYKYELFRDSLCVIKDDMLIIFFYVDPYFFRDSGKRFLTKAKHVRDEISGLTWYTETEFYVLFYGNTMQRIYSLVRDFITSISFFDLVKSLKSQIISSLSLKFEEKR